MYPHERSLVKKLAKRPFALLGVISDSSLLEVKEIKKNNDITWRSFFDGGGTGGPIATRWGVRGWPTIFVIDHKGVIRHRNLRGDRLEDAVMSLLKEARKDS